MVYIPGQSTITAVYTIMVIRGGYCGVGDNLIK